MSKFKSLCSAATVLAAGALAAAAMPTLAAPQLSSYSSKSVHTLQFNLNVVQENHDALARIGGDFASTYRFHKLAFSYEQPSRLHYEATIMGAKVAYTINNNEKYISIPAAHVHKVENVAGQPGKKQTLLDCGLIPPELLQEYNGFFLHREGKLLVFQIQSKLPFETAKEIVWVDPVTHITTRRMHYNRAGRLESWFTYSQPIQASPHVFIPTRVEVYNAANQLGAVTTYTGVRVNGPVKASIFTF